VAILVIGFGSDCDAAKGRNKDLILPIKSMLLFFYHLRVIMGSGWLSLNPRKSKCPLRQNHRLLLRS